MKIKNKIKNWIVKRMMEEQLDSSSITWHIQQKKAANRGIKMIEDMKSFMHFYEEHLEQQEAKFEKTLKQLEANSIPLTWVEGWLKYKRDGKVSDMLYDWKRNSRRD